MSIRQGSPEPSNELENVKQYLERQLLKQVDVTASGGFDTKSTVRSTSYNLLQSNKNRYNTSEENTRRSFNSNFRYKNQTNRERESSSSNSRSPIGRLSMTREKPLNRHASHSLCTITATTAAERKESAKRLLTAIELSEEKNRHSMSSIKTA